MVSVTGPMNALLDDISTAELSVTKFGMVMHRPKCHARRLVCFLQAHGHSVGSLFNNYFYDIHTCILLQLYHICFWKSVGHSRNINGLSKFQILSFVGEKKTKQTRPFRFSPRVAEAFVPKLTEATFECVAHAWRTETCRFALESAVHKTWSRSVSKVSLRAHCICEAASWIDLRNQGTICENVSCLRERIAVSIDRAPTEPSPAKRRCFQTFKKASHEKWPFVTIDKKGNSCVNSEVRSTVVKWLDW